MADAVSTNVIYEDKNRYVVFLTGVSDGTGESIVVKVDKSAIGTSTAGIEAVALDIERAQWVVTTFVKVTLLWDHASDRTALVCAGSGAMDFTGLGGSAGWGFVPGVQRLGGLPDPVIADSTGDILLTSSATANGTYAILLWLRKRA
jgi:hypothetical protein